MSNYRDLIDRLDGYEVGNLIVEDGQAFIQQYKSGIRITTELMDKDTIEVFNLGKYEPLSLDDAINKMSTDGWPAFAGLYIRVKGGLAT